MEWVTRVNFYPPLQRHIHLKSALVLWSSGNFSPMCGLEDVHDEFLIFYIRKLCKTAIGPHHRASLQTPLWNAAAINSAAPLLWVVFKFAEFLSKTMRINWREKLLHWRPCQRGFRWFRRNRRHSAVILSIERASQKSDNLRRRHPKNDKKMSQNPAMTRDKILSMYTRR